MRETIGEKLVVLFNGDHNTFINIGGGILLERPDAWEHKEGTETENKQINHNVNKIEVNPQFAKIIVSGRNDFFKQGDIVFTHYMAHETADFFELDEIGEVAIIDEDTVMFKIVDGKYIMPNGYYLGEQIMENTIETPSGLIFDIVEKKKALTVKITHVPNNSSYIALNDVIKTIDDYNYQFPFEGKQYVFLKEEEIVAKMI